MSLKFKENFVFFAALMLALAGVGGCSADDVQLNGKIFDAAGLTTSSAPKKTPKLAERAPLIVPPSLDKLPDPGTGEATAAIGDVKDHDDKYKVSRADQEREQAAYCKIHYEDAKIRGDQDYETAAGPLGRCRGSVLNIISNVNKSDDDK
jgi:hypothetical protein